MSVSTAGDNRPFTDGQPAHLSPGPGKPAATDVIREAPASAADQGDNLLCRHHVGAFPPGSVIPAHGLGCDPARHIEIGAVERTHLPVNVPVPELPPRVFGAAGAVPRGVLDDAARMEDGYRTQVADLQQQCAAKDARLKQLETQLTDAKAAEALAKADRDAAEQLANEARNARDVDALNAATVN